MEDTVMRLWIYAQTLPWEHIIGLLGTSSIVVVLTHFFKTRLNNKTKVKILSFVGVLSLIPDLLTQIVNNPQFVQYLPPNFTWVFTAAVGLHAILESPVFRKLKMVLTKYKIAVVPNEALATNQVAISNPNYALNKPSQSNLVEQPEQAPLQIQG